MKRLYKPWYADALISRLHTSIETNPNEILLMHSSSRLSACEQALRQSLHIPETKEGIQQ
jgi:hypothetical protein